MPTVAYNVHAGHIQVQTVRDDFGENMSSLHSGNGAIFMERIILSLAALKVRVNFSNLADIRLANFRRVSLSELSG